MDCNESIFAPSLKVRTSQGTFVVGALRKYRKNIGAMKVASICNNFTLEVNAYLFCTEDMLESTHEHRISDSETSETHKSDSCLLVEKTQQTLPMSLIMNLQKIISIHMQHQ